MNDLDKAQMMAPEGEFLAYINPKEAGILKALGGSGKLTSMGIPSFAEDEEDQNAMNSPDYGSQDNEEQQSIDRGDPTANMSTRSRDLQGFGPGTNINDLYGGGGGENNFIQTIGNLYNRFSPVANIGRGMGFLGRGIGNLFDKFADLRGFNPDGSRRTQDEYEKDRQDRINQNRISNIMGRDAPFTQMTLNNLEGLYESLYGKGNVPSNINESLIGTTNTTRSGAADDFYPDRVEGIVSQAPEEYRFTDAMANLNLERGVPRDQVFLSAKDFIDQNKAIGSEDTRNVKSRISDTFGFNSNYIDLSKTFGLEELLAAKAGKTGFFGGLTDQGKALEDFRNSAVNFKNAPGNPNNTAQSAFQFMMDPVRQNMFKDVQQNKDYIQEQINQGFLQKPEDYINQKALGSYF